MTIGERIKENRKKRNYTLKNLADITGLSVGFLSNIERNLNSPSISNLQQICDALDVNLMEIIDNKKEVSPVARFTDREEIFSNSNAHMKIENIMTGKSSLNGIVITIEGQSDQYTDLSWGHSYDEAGVVIEGKLEIELNSKIYILEKGDSIFIKSFTPHRYRNPISEKSIVYWFSIKK